MSILATSPWIKVGKELAKRVVLESSQTGEGIPFKFIVSDEFHQGDKAYYCNKDYFWCWMHGRPEKDFVVSAYEEAFKKFQERSAKNTLGHTFDKLFSEFHSFLEL